MSIVSRRRFLHTTGLAGLAAFGCQSRFEAALPAIAPAPLDPAVGPMINALAIELLPKLKAESANPFFSPFSISTALGMTATGARGRTLEQMQKVLHLPAETEKADGRYLGLMSALISKGKPYELSTANAIWGQKGFAWRPEFEKRVMSYGAGLRAADFETLAEKERITINKWVEGQTRDKIQNLFAEGSINSLTRLVLVNAIYFKGNWQDAFKPSATKKQPFTNADGSKSVASLMYRTGDYRLYQDADLQALVMPYKGNDLSMVVALPRKVDGLPALEAKLTDASFTTWVESAKFAHDLNVHLPKFKLETSYTLNDSLIGLGMVDAFDPSADFTGMHSSAEKLFISLAVHKAFVDVNEEGTEAAAATGFAMVKSAAPVSEPLRFRADHPFLFAIRHNESGAILFMGRVEKL